MDKGNPIGVFDSGVGGLTLLPELMRLCPGEDIVYFGDSANCPYGNRGKEDLEALVLRILGFLREQKVKMVAIACNTTSSMLDNLPGDPGFPLVDIVTPVAGAVSRSGVGEVGVIATNFTACAGVYSRTIRAENPSVAVYEQGSANLAALVDHGAPEEEIDAAITEVLGELFARRPLEHLILGCTHYPIVLDRFQALYPAVTYIDPVVEQAKEVARRLDDLGLRNPQEEGALRIYTSGGPGGFPPVLRRLGIKAPACIETRRLD